MSIRALVRAALPDAVVRWLRRGRSRPTRARKESNEWLRVRCADIRGEVLSIGSGSDDDDEGSYYRSYFASASSYTTSDVSEGSGCDLTLDIRSMPEIEDESFDCVFCSGVLEHVDDFQAGLGELTRVLRTGGVLLLGVPFRQAIHMSPQDFWRFTEHGIRHLLKQSYEISDLVPIDAQKGVEFPAAYWVKAIKTRGA
jgi:SAM-dependent methyltransferase